MMICCDNYSPLYDPIEEEIVCQSCGSINIEESELAKELLVNNEDIVKASDNRYIANIALFNELGSSNSYISPSNKGTCFELGNVRARDYTGKRVRSTVLKDGYATGMYMDRNVRLVENKATGKSKAIHDYSLDKWLREGKMLIFQMISERGLEQHQAIAANKELKRLYSNIVVGILPELLAEIAYCNATVHEPNKKFTAYAEDRINELKDKLRASILTACQKHELEQPQVIQS